MIYEKENYRKFYFHTFSSESFLKRIVAERSLTRSMPKEKWVCLKLSGILTHLLPADRKITKITIFVRNHNFHTLSAK